MNLDPRLSLSYAPSDESSLRLAWGLYSQSPEPYHVLEPWGNSNLKSRRAVHFIAEAERQIGDSLSVKAAAYQKRQSGLVISDPVDIYVNKGTGLARGVELFAKYNLSDKFLGWFSYAYGRSTRRDDPEEEERLFSFDQTHVATVAAVLAPSPKWEIGFKWHYATGLPYTPVVDANLAIDGASGFYYEPMFGPTNSARLPYYSRLDVRGVAQLDAGGGGDRSVSGSLERVLPPQRSRHQLQRRLFRRRKSLPASDYSVHRLVDAFLASNSLPVRREAGISRALIRCPSFIRAQRRRL